MTSLRLKTQETMVRQSSLILMYDRDIHDTIFIVLKLIDDDCDLTCSVLSNILTMRGLRH